QQHEVRRIMRRTRKDGTKVWHNPEIMTAARGRGATSTPRPTETPEDRRAAKQNRAALEALFAPKKDAGAKTNGPVEDEKRPAVTPKPGRIVLPPPPNPDPRVAERHKLLGKLLGAEGRPAVSKAANEFLRAGFTFPEEQDVYLQLLEHTSEDHVRTAIDVLSRLLAGELPRRRAVLESRLRRIEQFADEPATRTAAERLRRQVSGRPDGPTPPSAQ
ncbi:MAG TPA: hypothetical protein VHB21_23200, partial [Minicystis sp.]|nr:hypothetical protein [Minicystis sp.]